MATKEEYDTLRTEMLSLSERAYRAWRFGLIEIAAVAAFLWANAELANKVLSTELKFGALLLLSVVAAGIAMLESWSALTFERAADRLGGFLTVFHGDPGAQKGGDTRDIGWHAWNRIEKVAKKVAKKEGEPPKRITYIGKMCWIFVLVLIAFFGLLWMLAVAGCLSIKYRCWLLAAAAIEILGLTAFLLWQTREAKLAPVRQTVRWYEMAQLTPAQVEKYLEKWGRSTPELRGSCACLPQSVLKICSRLRWK
ncbi:MAG: hypothetical protein ACREV4_03925 [Gammaproteobacteria bacterium]